MIAIYYGEPTLFRLVDILRFTEKHLLLESVPLTEINDTLKIKAQSSIKSGMYYAIG